MSTDDQHQRAVIYCRVSQGRDSELNAERQLGACQQLAELRGYDVVEVVVDQPVEVPSGTVRPGFERVLDMATTSAVDVVVCWHVNRLAPSEADLQRVLDVGVGVDPVRVSRLDSHDPSGALAAELRGLTSAHKAARQRATVRQRERAGVLPPRTWGYEDGKPTDECRRVIPAIHTAFQESGNIADAVRTFARMTNAKASRAQVRGHLQRPAYAGLVVVDGEVDPTAQPQWQPVIDEATWRRTQALLSQPARQRTSHERGLVKALGSALYVCGECGQLMTGGGLSAAGHPMYRCSSGKHTNRGQAAIDTVVLSVLTAGLVSAGVHFTTEDTASARDADKAAAIEAELHDRRARLAQFTEDYAAGLLPRSVALDGIEQQRQQVTSLEQELATTRPTNRSTVRAYSLPLTISSMPLHALRQLVAACVRVTVYSQVGGKRRAGAPALPRPESVRIEWLDEPAVAPGRATSTSWLGGPDAWEVSGYGMLAPSWVRPWLDGLETPVLSSATRERVADVVTPYLCGISWGEGIDGPQPAIVVEGDGLMPELRIPDAMWNSVSDLG